MQEQSNQPHPQSMTKRIFIGSSTEAEPYVKMLCPLLNQQEHIEALPWREAFDPSELTLAAIESVTRKVSGAILLASPDDTVSYRGKSIRVPRSNVIFELGLLSASFGRPNVALCKFSKVTLPTDLDSFTYIDMGDFDPKAPKLSSEAKERLIAWANRLWILPCRITRTSLWSGYSGRWRMTLAFSRWRGRDIGPESSVRGTGYIDLFSALDGGKGWGAAHGELDVLLCDKASPIPHYQARIKVCDRIFDCSVSSGAELRFKSETHARFVDFEEGDSRNTPGARTRLGGIVHYDWHLKPNPNGDSDLAGTYHTEGTHYSEATVKMWKHE